jgi:hypothetical protein
MTSGNDRSKVIYTIEITSVQMARKHGKMDTRQSAFVMTMKHHQAFGYTSMFKENKVIGSLVLVPVE